MTNQTAILILDSLRRGDCTDVFSEIQIKEALCMAINVLEDKSRECENCRYKTCRTYDAFRRCSVPCDFCIRSIEGRLDMYAK